MNVYDQFGKTIVLKDQLGAGGEGTVYRVSGRECAKIYTNPTPFKEAKISTMIAKPPRPLTDPTCKNGRVAWPTKNLYDCPGGHFIGYMMPLIELNKYQESEVVFIEKQRTKTFGERFTYEHLMIAAYNFAMTVHFIHLAGHSVGDLREKNILVDASGQVCLVDCDSFQIMDPAKKRFFASQTYTPAYLAPEWTDKDLSKANRRGNDHFALGVWIFQMLMNGMHPYQARGGKADHAPSLSEKIKKGTYPYARARGLKPPVAAPDFDQVPKSLQVLFQACFVNGHRHPDDRPQALAYADTLKHEIGRLKTCKKNRNHRYSGDRARCPFCTTAIPVKPVQKRSKAKSPSPTKQPMVSTPIHFPNLPGMQLPSWTPSYGRGGSTMASRRAFVQFLSRGLLVLLLFFGVFGFLRGVTGALASVSSPGFVQMPKAEEGEEETNRFSGSINRMIDRIVGLPGRLFSDKEEEDAADLETEEMSPEHLNVNALLLEDFDLWYMGGVLYQNRWEEPHFQESLRIDGLVKENGIGSYIRPEETDDGAHIMQIELRAKRSGQVNLHYGAESWWCWAPAYGQYKLAFSLEGEMSRETLWLEWNETGRIELDIKEGETLCIEIREKSGWKGTLNPVLAFE
jgi:serine/threonine protein kinase